MLEKFNTFTSPDPATNLSTRQSAIFWGEISPCEHLVQIYNDDCVFLDALEGFAYGGIVAGDGVIVIATPEHRAALAHRLDKRGIDVHDAAQRDQYLALDAAETLSQFMISLDGTQWPDSKRFHTVVTDVITRAGRNPDGTARKVRAFGEMVALLWANGNTGATFRLEHLWHDFCQKNAFCLFCAYPRSGFTEKADLSMQHICDVHSKVIPG